MHPPPTMKEDVEVKDIIRENAKRLREIYPRFPFAEAYQAFYAQYDAFAFPGGLRGGAVEAGLQVALALGADHLFSDLAVLDDEQGGDGGYLELRGEALVFIDIDLADLDFALILAGQFVQNGCNHLARSAPFGPEIDQDGRRGFQDLGFKIILREGDDQR